MADARARAKLDLSARWAPSADAALRELCEWVETRGSQGHLMAFARAKGVPYSTLRDWINADIARVMAYATARDRRADVIAEELLAIADEPPPLTPQGNVDPGAIAHQRLRVEARKWIASKLAPRQYGEKVEVDTRLSVDPLAELRELVHRGNRRLPLAPAGGDSQPVMYARAREDMDCP